MKREELAPMEWINEIFARFTLVYRHFWTESFPTDLVEAAAKYEWATTLHDLTYEQIKRTISKCKATMKFPPLLPEFRQLALNLIPGCSNPVYEQTNPYKIIKRSDPKIAAAAIGKFRAILTNVNNLLKSEKLK